jgi:anaerobic selenocysteine-containing dehydrogenase
MKVPGQHRFRGFTPALQVAGFIATRPGDPERGPALWIRPDDALIRLITEGELARVISERRSELAVVYFDESLARGTIVLRDVAGALPSEVVRVVKPDVDFRPRV